MTLLLGVEVYTGLTGDKEVSYAFLLASTCDYILSL